MGSGKITDNLNRNGIYFFIVNLIYICCFKKENLDSTNRRKEIFYATQMPTLNRTTVNILAI